MKQEWDVILQDPLLNWFETLAEDDLLKIYAALELLSTEDPQLGRPYADTLQGAKYANLKELRVQSKLSVFRLFYIFDPIRQAIVLCGGDKKGKKEKLFYREMIALADKLMMITLLNFHRSKKMSAKFKDLMNSLPAEKQAKVKAMADDMRMELQLYRIREELELSQKQMAEALNISQPSVVALEKRGNDVKLSSVKRYIEAMGGALNLSVKLPTGKIVTFDL